MIIQKITLWRGTHANLIHTNFNLKPKYSYLQNIISVYFELSKVDTKIYTSRVSTTMKIHINIRWLLLSTPHIFAFKIGSSSLINITILWSLKSAFFLMEIHKGLFSHRYNLTWIYIMIWLTFWNICVRTWRHNLTSVSHLVEISLVTPYGNLEETKTDAQGKGNSCLHQP